MVSPTSEFNSDVVAPAPATVYSISVGRNVRPYERKSIMER
jgi:hypothetical protein